LKTLEEVKFDMIVERFHLFGGNKVKVAKSMALSERTLTNWLRKYKNNSSVKQINKVYKRVDGVILSKRNNLGRFV